MCKKSYFVLTAALLTSPLQLHAQNAAPAAPTAAAAANNNKINDTEVPNRFWQANVGGGQYMVALGTITAVSRHKYLLDGAIVVDEVTVDTTGQSLARFYFLSPISDKLTGNGLGNTASRIVDRGREIIENKANDAGTDVHNMVVKKFPETTHAHCIEYRLLSAEELSGLFNSVRTAWETGHGRSFSIKKTSP